MTKEKYVYITPRLGPLQESGELIYTVAIFGDATPAEIQGILRDAYLIAQNPPAKYFLCRSQNLGDVNAKTGRLKKLQNVESVVVTLTREQLIAWEFIHQLIRKQISKK